MTMTIQLTEAQIRQYAKEGYLLLRHADYPILINPERLAAWTSEVQAFPKVQGKWMPYEEINSAGQRQLMRTENYVDYHTGFSSLLRGEALASILTQLTGEPHILFKDKINYKSTKSAGFNAHLDAPAYTHISPTTHTTATISIDAANTSNGCLQVVPGSHLQSVPLQGGQANGAIDVDWEEKATWVPVAMEKGDVLIFGSVLAHRSARNESGQSRRMVYATYTPKSAGLDLRERYYAHRRAHFPPEHERVKGKDYADGWRTYGFAAPFSKAEVEAAVAS